MQESNTDKRNIINEDQKLCKKLFKESLFEGSKNKNNNLDKNQKVDATDELKNSKYYQDFVRNYQNMFFLDFLACTFSENNYLVSLVEMMNSVYNIPKDVLISYFIGDYLRPNSRIIKDVGQAIEYLFFGSDGSLYLFNNDIDLIEGVVKHNPDLLDIYNHNVVTQLVEYFRKCLHGRSKLNGFISYEEAFYSQVTVNTHLNGFYDSEKLVDRGVSREQWYGDSCRSIFKDCFIGEGKQKDFKKFQNLSLLETYVFYNGFSGNVNVPTKGHALAWQLLSDVLGNPNDPVKEGEIVKDYKGEDSTNRDKLKAIMSLPLVVKKNDKNEYEYSKDGQSLKYDDLTEDEKIKADVTRLMDTPAELESIVAKYKQHADELKRPNKGEKWKIDQFQFSYIVHVDESDLNDVQKDFVKYFKKYAADEKRELQAPFIRDFKTRNDFLETNKNTSLVSLKDRIEKSEIEISKLKVENIEGIASKLLDAPKHIRVPNKLSETIFAVIALISMRDGDDRIYDLIQNENLKNQVLEFKKSLERERLGVYRYVVLAIAIPAVEGFGIVGFAFIVGCLEKGPLVFDALKTGLNVALKMLNALDPVSKLVILGILTAVGIGPAVGFGSVAYRHSKTNKTNKDNIDKVNKVKSELNRN